MSASANKQGHHPQINDKFIVIPEFGVSVASKEAVRQVKKRLENSPSINDEDPEALHLENIINRLEEDIFE